MDADEVRSIKTWRENRRNVVEENHRLGEDGFMNIILKGSQILNAELKEAKSLIGN